MRNFRTVLVLCLATLSCVLRAQDKLRIIIETDAGGDADDEQSLVRFLAYANEWDVEGIIANRPVARPVENLNPERTGLGIAQRLVRAYGEVYPNLKENAEGYPTEAYLMDRTVAGYNSTEAGVNLIIAAVDRDDPRPIWFLNWGTDWGSAQSCLQRALDKVLGERGYEGYSKFKNKIRLSSSDRFNDHTTKLQPFWRMWVEKQFPLVDGEMWYHRFAPLTAKAGGFNLQRDVLTGHGALGALYPTNTTVPQKEGDSILFVYLIPTGMNDPMHPDWGSWGGRYGVRDDFFRHVPTYYGPNVRDTWNGTTNRDNTLARWAADFMARDAKGASLGNLSPRGEARGAIGDATISVDYGRPMKRGRAVFGGVVLWDRVWRTGANAATGLVTDKDIMLGDTRVPAGSYTLFSLPSRTGWKLIVSKRTGEWGTEYDSTADFARIPMRVSGTPRPVEQFTIGIAPSGESRGIMTFTWDTTVGRLPIHSAGRNGS